MAGSLVLVLWGCEKDPCATDPSLPLQARIDAACDGGEVSVAAGTFPGNVEIRRPLTLKGAGQDRTILQGTEDESVVIVSAEATAVRLEGLTITGGTTGSCEDEPDCRSRAGGGLMVLGSVTLVDVRVTGNQARDAGGGIWVGYDFEAGASGRLFTERDVLVDDNAAPSGGGIEVATARAEIARNTGSEAAGAWLMYDRYGESYLNSTHGDWGTTEDVDIAFEVGGGYTFGDDASFHCISIGCF